jgi:hypothetical protein
MNHADTAHTLISLCRPLTGWAAGLSLFSELRWLTGLRLTGLRRLPGLWRLLRLSYFHRRIRLLGRSRTGLSGLRLNTGRERTSQRKS